MPLTAAEQTFESMTNGYSCDGQMQSGSSGKAETQIARISTNGEPGGTGVPPVEFGVSPNSRARRDRSMFIALAT